MVNIDIDSTSIFEARKNIQELNKEYTSLRSNISELNSTAKENNGLTIQQNKELEESKTRLSEVNVELSQYESLLDEADPKNLTASFKEMNGETVKVGKQMSELKNRLYQMRMEGLENTEEFQELSIRVTDLNTAIYETNRELNALGANDGLVGINQQIRSVGTSILTWDFSAANKGMEGLNTAMEGLDFEKIGNDISGLAKNMGKGLVSSFKMATKSTWAFAKALWATGIPPIVLAVSALVGAIVLLQKKFGLFDPIIKAVTKIFDSFMKYVNKVIDRIKWFLDLTGMTNFKERELAAEREERDRTEAERIKEGNNIANDAMKNELKILEAKGANTEEEIRLIGEKKQEIIQNNIEIMESNTKLLESELKSMEARGIRSAKDREKADELRRNIQENNKEIASSYADLEVQIINTEDQISKFREKTENETNRKVEEARRKHNEEMEKIAEERLRAEEVLAKINEDLRLNAIDNLFDRELEKNLKNLQEERDEILKNEQLTNEEIIKINEYYDNLEIEERLKRDENKRKLAEDINNKINEEEALSRLKHLEELSTLDEDFEKLSYEERLNILKENIKHREKYEEEVFKRKKTKLKNERDELLKNVNLEESEILRIKEYYNKLIEEEEKNHINTMEDIRRGGVDREIKETEREYNDKQDRIKNLTDSITAGFDSANLGIAESMLNLTDIIGDGLSDIISSFKDGDGSVGDIIGQSLMAVSAAMDMITAMNAEKTRELLLEQENQTNESMGRLQESLDNGLISKTEFDDEMHKLNVESFKKTEKIKKDEFESNKKMEIANATIAMFQGMVSAYTSVASIPIVGPILGAVLAAAVGTMGGINIAKIKKTNFKSGTPPTTAANVNINEPSRSKDPMASTNFGNIFDNTGSSDNVKDLGNNNTTTTQNINVTSTISVSEINDVSDTLSKYNEGSTL